MESAMVRSSSNSMHGKRGRLMVPAILAVSSLTLAACASSGGSSGVSSGGSASAGDITWWGFAPTVKASAVEYIKAFNGKYPNIHVTFRQIPIDSYDAAMRPALSSSAGPDVYEIAPGGGIASIQSFGGFATNMEPVIKKALGPDWKSKVSPTGISGLTTSSGELAGLSIGSTFAGPVWINQDIFSKYGLKPPTTLPEWENVCATLKAHKVNCLAHGAGQVAFNQDVLQAISDSVKPGVWTAASKGEAKWTDPAIVEALQIWQKMFQTGIMEPGALGLQQYPDANNDFLSGKAAMVMMGTWYMNLTTASVMQEAISAAGVAGAKPFSAVAVEFPDVAGKGNPAALFGDVDWGLAVNKKSKNVQASQTFASWLTTTTDGQQVVANTLNEIPALKGVQPKWGGINFVDKTIQQPMLQNLITKTGDSSEPRLSLVSAKLQQAIGDASQTAASGKSTPATPAEAAATLQSVMGP